MSGCFPLVIPQTPPGAGAVRRAASGHQWHVEEGRASKPPCDQPGVLWYVEELVGSMLGSPLGDLYTFTVKEVGAGAEVVVKVRCHVPVRRYQRNHG